MPSRKRAKGKERKLKQQARQSVSSSHQSPAVGGDISQPEQNIPRIVEQATNRINCLHGAIMPPQGHPVDDFIRTFDEGCVPKDGKIKIAHAMRNTFDKHEDFWKDSTLRKMVINIMLSHGTDMIIAKSIKRAKTISEAITFLENYDGEGPFKSVLSKATEDLTYLVCAGERDLFYFYKKRIPCSCLDELYAKIKKCQVRGSMCSHCKQTVKLKDIKTCSRCKFAQYCSVECQKLHWPSHKEKCISNYRFHKDVKKAETARRNGE